MLYSYVKFFRAERHALLFGIACAFLSSPGQTFIISIFIRPIMEALGLSSGELGLLYLIATLGSASLLPLAGSWLDHADLRLYAAIVLAGLGVACGVMSIASDVVALVVGLLLLRLTGQGLMTHIAVVSIARYFERSRGRALSFVALGLPLAEAVMPQIALALIAVAGWRVGYAIIGSVILFAVAPVLLALIWKLPRFTRPSFSSDDGRPKILDGLGILVRSRFFWWVLPNLLFMPFVSTALIFHIRTIALIRNWGDVVIGAGFVAYAIGHGIGLLISGEFVDRFSARSTISAMNVPFILGIAALGTLTNIYALPIFLALTGLTSGFVQTTAAAVWAEVYGMSRLGTVRSFATMLTVGATAVGPVTVGLLLDRNFSVGSISSLFVVSGMAAGALATLNAR